MMNTHKIQAFTVIELVIVITLTVILAVSTFIPYQHYGNKLKLNQSVREVAKTITHAKNLALNGVVSLDSNVSVGAYISSEEGENTKVQIYSFPYSQTGSSININHSEANIIKEITLHQGIIIDSVGQGQSFLFYFHAITGVPEFYYWDDQGVKEEFSGESIDIGFSYKGSSDSIMKKSISYFPKTNIINY